MSSPVLHIVPAARTVAHSRFAAALLLAIFALALPFAAQAQSYVYANNQDIANSVVAYSVSSSGTLTQVSGSPFATGGIGPTAVAMVSTASPSALLRICFSFPTAAQSSQTWQDNIQVKFGSWCGRKRTITSPLASRSRS